MSGHGHVTPNPNGMKARCGGPGLCSVCSAELAATVSPPAMSVRISDERLAEMLMRAGDTDAGRAMRQLQRYRALGDADDLSEKIDSYRAVIAELHGRHERSRALVTELRSYTAEIRRAEAAGFSILHLIDRIDSLLAAHDAQHDIQAVAAQATREGIIGIDFDAQQAEGKGE